MQKPKIIAFLLPQFHEIHENCKWWGPGFTEWTNVKKAEKIFPRHQQPRVPKNGNYYNLLNPEVREWQARLAKDHSVYGFCYYHYWFNGKQLLEQPINEIISLRSPDFPFCVAWANHSWSRTWAGNDDEILIQQSYGSSDDWEKHYKYLEKLFQDPRYIRVNERPMILVYRPEDIEEGAEMFTLWRKMARMSGLPGLHIVAMKHGEKSEQAVTIVDASVEFEPKFTLDNLPLQNRVHEWVIARANRIYYILFNKHRMQPRSRSYASVWKQIISRINPPSTYLGAFLDWDNTPRRGVRGLVMRNASADIFRKMFSRLYRKAIRLNSEFIFVNAWNEWSEGTYLEPDEKNGTAYLQAIQSVVAEHHGAG